MSDATQNKILAIVSDNSVAIKEIKTGIAELKESNSSILTGLDGVAKSIDDLKVEYAAIVSHIDRHARRIKKIAEKVGIELES